MMPFKVVGTWQFPSSELVETLGEVYQVSQKKYTSLTSKIFALRTDQTVTLASFVRQLLKLDFDNLVCQNRTKIDQVITF